MKILFVVDQFKSGGNGTTISAERFVSCLRNLGHQVRVVTTGHSCEDLYIVPERYVFLATEFARKQGLLFAKPDKKVLTEAIEWCDIVHFVMPFAISKRGVKIAKKLKKPYTAAFHVQAENITYNIGLGRSKLARNIVYYFLKRKFYRRVENIHCPSEFIANELRKHKYKGNLHVISNGVNSVFKPKKCEKPDEIKDKIIITMVGRHSAEKRQDLLIKAVDYS
ncbi:MAG: glycosyltransferase, partial [Clostridia bacterium]|nr:glycosyltransferase [Clostridia bacterium]